MGDKVIEDFMNEITLDYDVKFETFKSTNIYRRLNKWAVVDDFRILVMYRRSPSGHVHVRFPWITVMGGFRSEEFMLRAHLGDDPMRIYNDLKRAYEDKDTGRLWDFKSSGRRMRRAGRWRRLF